MKKTILLRCLFLVALFILVSCSHDSQPDPDGDFNLDPYRDDMEQTSKRSNKTDVFDYSVQAGVKLMSINQQDALLRCDNASTLVFKSGLSPTQLPSVGQTIVLMEANEVLPYGFYGKVVSIEENGVETVVKTKKVPLSEVFSKLDIHTQISASEARIYDPYGNEIIPETETKAAVGMDEKVVPLKLEKSFEPDNEGYKLGLSFSLAGSLSINGKVDLDFSPFKGHIYVKPLISTKLEAEFGLDAHTSVGFKQTKRLLAVVALPSPLAVVGVGFNVYGYFSAEGKLEILTTYKLTRDIGFELNYNENGVETHFLDESEIKEVVAEGDFISYALEESGIMAGHDVTFKGSANFGIGVRGMFGINVFNHPLYDFNNLYFDVWGGFKGDTSYEILDEKSDNALYELTHNAKVKLEVDAIFHADADFLSHNRVKELGDVYEIDEETDTYRNISITEEEKPNYTLKKQFEAKLKFELRTFYLYPSFSTFSCEMLDYGRAAKLSSMVERPLLFPLTIGYALYLAGSDELVGEYDKPTLFWGDFSESYQEITCDGLLPNIDYDVYPYVRYFGRAIKSDKPSYSFRMNVAPAVITVNEPKGITHNGASLSAEFDKGNSGDFTERGFYYSTEFHTPEEGKGTRVVLEEGSNSLDLSRLASEKTYYVRAYGINRYGIVYSSNVVSFKTLPIKAISISTLDVSGITKTSATLSGLFDSGSFQFTSHGFCLSSTSSNLSLDNSKVYTTTGSSVTITDLSSNTHYYVKAFASDNTGTTHFGNLVEFTTEGEARINVSPHSVYFEETFVGESSSENITLHNSGGADLVISKFAIQEPFSVNCDAPVSVKSGKDLIIPVSFSPTSSGTFNCNFKIVSNASNSSEEIVTLKGVSTVPLYSEMTLSTDHIGFSNQTLGSSSSKSFYIYNTGNATLDVSSITVSGASSYSVTPSKCSIGPSCKKEITVSFLPTSVGNQNAEIIVSSNARINNKATIKVVGSGTEEPKPLISISPESLDFQSVEVGTSKELSFKITNTGNADLVISKIGIGTQSSLSVSLSSAIVKPSGSHQTVTVKYQPTQPGSFSDFVFIKSNASNYDTKYVIVNGNAVSPIRVKASFSDIGAEHLYVQMSATGIPETLSVNMGVLFSKTNRQPTLNGTNCEKFETLDGDYVARSASFILSGLSPGSQYYARAYFATGQGVYYSDVTSFITKTAKVPDAIDLGLSVKWSSWDIGSADELDQGSAINLKDARSVASSLGDGWHIPTNSECCELIENCRWELKTMNSLYIFVAISKINGKSIYFPFYIGDCYWEGTLINYWTETSFNDSLWHSLTISYYPNAPEYDEDIYVTTGHLIDKADLLKNAVGNPPMPFRARAVRDY